MNTQTQEALKTQLGDIIDGMRTKAINNVTIKSSTLERFADELNQFEIELHKALEQPAQEPVADYVIIDGLKYPAMVEVMAIHDERGKQTEDNCDCINAFLPQGTKLYTHPAPAWQGLSDREIMLIISKLDNGITRQPTLLEQAIIRAIEQALKEKNHG